MTTGEKIKELRIERGWTQEELAKRCGYSGKSVISKTESLGNNVGTKKIAKIAKAFGVSPTSLIDWEYKEITDPRSDKSAVLSFLETADDNAIHQLRLYSDFLRERGD